MKKMTAVLLLLSLFLVVFAAVGIGHADDSCTAPVSVNCTDNSVDPPVHCDIYISAGTALDGCHNLQ